MRPPAVTVTRRAARTVGPTTDEGCRPQPVDLRAPDHDRGEIVTGWLVRIVVTGAILALVLFDAVSIGVAKMSVSDTAGNAARAASTSWNTTHDQQTAFDAAWDDATDSNVADTIDPGTFRVDPDGTVHLTVRRTAPTLVVHLVRPVRGWATVQSEGFGRVDP